MNFKIFLTKGESPQPPNQLLQRGEPGANGFDGLPGDDGLDGRPGQNGLPGEKGVRGKY